MGLSTAHLARALQVEVTVEVRARDPYWREPSLPRYESYGMLLLRITLGVAVGIMILAMIF